MSDPRQAPEHIKPPNFRNAVTVLLLHIYIIALSLGVGCKQLLHWLPNPCPDIALESYLSSGMSYMLSHA